MLILYNLVRKEMQQLRWIIFLGWLLCAGLAALTVGTFHYFGEIVDEIPPEVTEMLAQYDITRELLLIFDDYSLYVWSQWNAKNLYQLAFILAIIISALQFAGEVNNHTMSFYLTRPINRWNGYVGKITAGVLIILLVFGAGTLMFWIASTIMGYTASWGRLLGALALSLIWASVFYLFTCIISILSREPVKAGVLAGVAGLALSVPGLFPAARHFSVFYQMRAVEYYVYGEPLVWSLLAGLFTSGVLLILGFSLFKKRDF